MCRVCKDLTNGTHTHARDVVGMRVKLYHTLEEKRRPKTGLEVMRDGDGMRCRHDKEGPKKEEDDTECGEGHRKEGRGKGGQSEGDSRSKGDRNERKGQSE